MNKKNRKDLEKVITELEKARNIIADQREIIEQMKDEEQDKFDNMSEGLQKSENASRIEEAAGYLSDAWSNIETAENECNDCIDYIQSAIDC